MRASNVIYDVPEGRPIWKTTPIRLAVTLVIGAEFNAELERGRAIAGGLPPDTEPFTELRDTRKLPAE